MEESIEYKQTVPSKQNPEQPKNKRKKHIWIAILWILTILLAVALTYAAMLFFGTNESATLDQAMQIIRDHFYFYEKDQDRLVDGAIHGMTQSLEDPYSTYYNEEEYAALTKTNSGNYTGIGIVLQQQESGAFEIVQVYPNTPAEEAGFCVHDIVIELNGISAEGMALDAFLTNMIKENGVENKIKVLRQGEELLFSVAAREIYAPTVVYRMQTDTIGYLQLSGFHGECVTEVQEAVEELREQGMQALIFDVRDNPGGSLYDVCDIADLFLPKGLVITSLRSRTEQQQDYKTENNGFEFPMVLLVNGNSASASELLAGALQDHRRAYVIGEQTFGKGIVQSYFLVPGTNGYVKITTEAYYTPNGVCIHGIGITPDLAVENSEEAKRYSVQTCPLEYDMQLQAAITYLDQDPS